LWILEIMTARLCILCCRNFHEEVAAAIAAEGWNDVFAVAFPARCGRPPLTWDELRTLLPEDCTQLVVLGRACLTNLGEAPAGFPALRVLTQQQCFHLVADTGLVAEAITDGGYLLTPGWLADWRGHIAEMGFPPEAAGDFFKDFARTLVLFDTGLDAATGSRLDELATAVGLPSRRIAVGLDHIRALLARIVLEWRLEGERAAWQDSERRHRRELADQVSAMDLLGRLARTRQEAEVIAAIEDVFRMLFAPATWHYLRVESGQPQIDHAIPAGMLAEIRQLHSVWAWTSSGQGFLLRISSDDKVLGLIAVDGLAFPEFRERYLNLALAISGVCALAIENARTRKRLAETEKMASLGILVAGVAHEINTPVGVGLAAASTLQEQSENLAQRFADRRMTQTDLQAYLAAAREEAALIRSNLERIGRLTDAFRQVAVEGKLPDRTRFRFRAAIEDVVASLGARMASDRVELRLNCDDALEIDSVPGDWSSIFTNLFINSLQHGFRGRDHGRIEVDVVLREGRLTVDYSDNGIGMVPETRKRVFDPFFTTDLQHGMGLGMHIVYNLVTQRFGGEIACDSEPGTGAHFHIEVPS
jgi:signal transduction histidine kinase